MGYDSKSSVKNLGTIWFFLAIYFVKLVFLVILKIISLKSEKAKKWYKWLFDKLFFGEILSICIEAYIELAVSSYLNLKIKHNEDVDNDLFGDELSILTT